MSRTSTPPQQDEAGLFGKIRNLFQNEDRKKSQPEQQIRRPPGLQFISVITRYCHLMIGIMMFPLW
jgi:hypothetical protein